MDAAIEIEGLGCRYGVRTVVHDVSLRVPPGVVYALLGPNGAGKTTVLKTLMNLRPPSRGMARVLGVDSRRLGPDHLARIGYVSENQRLPGLLRVRDVEAFCRPWYPRWDAALADDLRARFDLDPRARLRTLSRGQRIKVAFLLALAPRPALPVLDEPFSGLDPIVRDDVTAALDETARRDGTSVLVTSHEMDDLERFVDHVGFLDAGRLIVDEPLPALLDRCRRDTGAAMSLRDVFVTVGRARRAATRAGASV
jgi:ABC-2 type transport system ATP-binding protein